MATYRIRDIEPWLGNQIIIHLEHELPEHHRPTNDQGDKSESILVRLTVDEARPILGKLFDAYAMTMQNIAIDLAAGGCRNCDGRRTVAADGSKLYALQDGEGAKPCPVCVPRAEKRLRDKVHLRPRRDR